MGKYTITYPDGEREEIALFGPIKERERRIEYLEKYGESSKQREQRRKEETEKSKTEAVEKGLPELKGTEKQVNWAETIRANIFKKLNQDPAYKNYLIITNPEKYQELKSKAIAGGMSEPEFTKWNQPVFDMFIEADKRLRIEDKASWWIDNRSNYFTALYLIKGLYPDITKRYVEHEIAYKQWKKEKAQEPKPRAPLPSQNEVMKDYPELKPKEKSIPQPVQSKSTPPKKETRQYTQAELKGIHESRSPQSKAMDEMQSHQVTLEPDSPRVARWVRDQGYADIRGIDTPSRKKKRTVKKAKRKTSPATLKGMRR